MKTALAALVLSAATVVAAADTPAGWLHVQVRQGGDDAAKVDVNLPLSVLDVAISSVKTSHINAGRIQVGKTDMKLSDLRKAWAELRKAGDTPFVTVDEKDHTVRVEKKGDRVLVQVADKGQGTEKVRVDLPTGVVDALLAGEGEQLNLAGAIGELRRQQVGEFIRVEDGDHHVRVWID